MPTSLVGDATITARRDSGTMLPPLRRCVDWSVRVVGVSSGRWLGDGTGKHLSHSDGARLPVLRLRLVRAGRRHTHRRIAVMSCRHSSRAPVDSVVVRRAATLDATVAGRWATFSSASARFAEHLPRPLLTGDEHGLGWWPADQSTGSPPSRRATDGLDFGSPSVDLAEAPGAWHGPSGSSQPRRSAAWPAQPGRHDAPALRAQICRRAGAARTGLPHAGVEIPTGTLASPIGCVGGRIVYRISKVGTRPC